MPKKSSSRPVKKPEAKKAGKKAALKTIVKKAAKRTVKKPALGTTIAANESEVARPGKRQRATVLNEHPDNIAVDERDHAAIESVEKAKAKAARVVRGPRKLTAADNASNPVVDQPPAASLVERVGDAIERELTKIERVIGNTARLHPTQRIETESRARVLASLARTLKEVMRLREQERGAGDDSPKAADDDAVPRDLDEFRRELSRRLEGLVAVAAPVPAGGNDTG